MFAHAILEAELRSAPIAEFCARRSPHWLSLAIRLSLRSTSCSPGIPRPVCSRRAPLLLPQLTNLGSY